MLASITYVHVVILMAVVLLLFGGKKLPELARGLGKGMRIFRDEMQGLTKAIEEPTPHDDKTDPEHKKDVNA